MKEFLDVEHWRATLTASFAELGNAVARYLPLLMGALLILAIGWVVSRVAAALVGWVLRRTKIDEAGVRLRFTEVMARAGMAVTPSGIISYLVFWVLMLTFLRAALESVRLAVLTRAVDALVGYIPSLLAAGMILVFGVLVGRLVKNLVSSAAATVNLPQSGRLGAAAQALMVLVAAVMAIERLGVETQILVATLTALVAGTALTMGAAFALGARPLVTHILAGHYLRQSLPTDQVIEIGGRKGVVEQVGAVDTILRDDQRRWSVSNGRILEEIVTR